MGKVRWTRRARGDLQAICEFIAKDSKRYADQFRDRVRRAVERLRDFPESGPLIHEPHYPGLRQITVGNYRVHATEVQILTVLHGYSRPDPDQPDLG